MTQPLVSIITPTTASPLLLENIASVKAQTYTNIEHLIVFDGVAIPHTYLEHITQYIQLPHATGHSRYNGHRIYGAMIYVVRGSYVLMLDEDDTIETTHIEDLVNTILTNNVEWAYTYRRIVDREHKFICYDECESLGEKTNVCGDRLVGVGSMLLPLKRAIQYTPLMYRKAREQGVEEIDRILTRYMLEHTHKGTGKYTMNYRVGSTEHSVKADFFIQGNKRYYDSN